MVIMQYKLYLKVQIILAGEKQPKNVRKPTSHDETTNPNNISGNSKTRIW